MARTVFFDADDTLWDEQGVLQTLERRVEETLDAGMTPVRDLQAFGVVHVGAAIVVAMGHLRERRRDVPGVCLRPGDARLRRRNAVHRDSQEIDRSVYAAGTSSIDPDAWNRPEADEDVNRDHGGYRT